jgi:hypothetical protein
MAELADKTGTVHSNLQTVHEVYSIAFHVSSACVVSFVKRRCGEVGLLFATKTRRSYA